MTARNVNIWERLRELRTHWAITQGDMAARMGVSLRAYQNYEAHEREPKAADLAALGDLGVSLDWLLTGTGQMLRDAPAATPSAVDLNLLRDCIQVLRDELRDQGGRLEPAKEAEAITLLYEIAQAEDGSTHRSVDRAVARRLLRLVS